MIIKRTFFWIIVLLPGASANLEVHANEINSKVVESSAERLRLPEFKTIPAVSPDQLTYSDRPEKRNNFVTWNRSHGDIGSTHFSSLKQINTSNVHKLKVAWVYHSGGSSKGIEANPIVVGNVAYFPIAGDFIVAVNAESGQEIWRFKSPYPEPAKRGLTWWPGTKKISPRIYFSAGEHVYALSPDSGSLIQSFGLQGAAGQGSSSIYILVPANGGSLGGPQSDSYIAFSL